LPLALLLLLLIDAGLRQSTNGILREFLSREARSRVFNDTYPMYRHVDLFRSLRRLAEQSAWSHRLAHSHPTVALLGILQSPALGLPTPAQQTKLCVGYEQFAFFPNDAFWLLEGPPVPGPERRVVVRLSNHHGPSLVEVACADPDQ